MSDKKDRRSNSETEVNPEALPQETQSDQRKQRLLDAARKRLASIDVGSDGKYVGDHAFRSDTLAFLEKECLSLPDQKFFALLSEIETILLQRDAEREAVKIETEMALDALVSWVEKPKLRTVAWNGMRELFGSDQKILKTNFAPDGYEPNRSAKHLHYYMSSEKRRANFRDEIESNPKRAAGLIVHWTEEHPVRKALLADGKKEVVAQIDEIRLELLRLHKPLWANGGALKNLSKIEEIVSGRQKRLSSGGAFEKEIWKEGFGRSVKTHEFADYAEYLISAKGEKAIATFVERISKDRGSLLWFIENVDDRHPVMLELKKRGNPRAAQTLMGLRSVILAKYMISEPLPSDFSKNKHAYIDNFERLKKNAEELKEFNAWAKKKLKDLWKEITEAYYSGDFAAADEAGGRAKEYFDKTFFPRLQKSRGDFWTIPEYCRPAEYDAICRMASSRMLFLDLISDKKAWGGQMDIVDTIASSAKAKAKNTLSDIAAAVRGTSGSSDRRKACQKAFESAIWGSGSPSIAFISDEKTQTKTLEEFGKMLQGVTEGRTEISSDGFARYVSYLHDTLGPEKLRTELQSRWNGKYEDLVLKFGNLWGLFEGAPKNSAAQRIMGKIAPEALVEFKKIVKEDGECVIRKRANGGLPDIEANLRKTSWLDEKKIAEILSELRKYDGDPTKQFDVLCQKIENVSYSTILSFFKKNADRKAEVSETLREQADRTISPKMKMSAAPGFSDLLSGMNALSKNVGKPESSKQISMLAQKMSDSSESTSAAFLQKIPEKELREILDVAKAMHSRKIPSSNPSKIGVFANWLEAKLESRKTEIAANVSAGIAHKVHEQTVRSGKNPGEAISEAEKKELWLAMTDIAGTAIKASEARRVADALRSEGKEAAAAEITRQITGKDSWDARTAIWERARMSEGISNLERIGFFERNKGGEIDLESAKSTIYKAYPNTAKDGEAPAEKSAIPYSNKASSFFQESSVGETANVGNACFATKTASGGLEIVSWGRKLRFEKSEALGATQQLDMLITANAEFLIPAMKDVALTSKIDLRNGIGREEARKMLSSVALVLGYDDIADEVDPRVLLGKFRAASEGAFWGPSLSERMRKYGIVDELGSLNRDGLRKRMIAVTSQSREETVGV